MARFRPTVAKSDPREARFIIQYTRNGICLREVLDCVSMDAITYEVNGEPQEVLCCNPATGKDEVVAILEQGGTKKVQFDLERLLPRDHLSKLMRLIKENCNTYGFLARGDECADPTDPDQFKILDSFGQLRFGAYSRSASVSRTKADAAAVTESTTVYAYDWQQYGRQDIGQVNFPPHSQTIVGLAHCDRKSCGDDICEADSDGCQRWLTVQGNGVVGYTTDQYRTGGLTPIPAAQMGTGQALGICCTRRYAVVYDSQGQIHYTTIADIINGPPTTWTTITNDTPVGGVGGVDIPPLSDCKTDNRGNVWFTSGQGGAGRVYQFQPGLGRVVNLGPITPSVADQTGIDIKDDTILITAGTSISRSNNGGRTFTPITITAPPGIPLPAGTTFATPVIIDRENWMVSTSNGYTLYTVDNGRSWSVMNFTGQGAGTVNDIAFDGNTRLYMSHSATAGGASTLHTGYYGTCGQWNQLPEGSDPLPANTGINKVVTCPEDGNVFVAAGGRTGGAGLIMMGTVNYE